MPDEAPVRFYAEEDARLPATVSFQLKELRGKCVAALLTEAVKDWGDYKRRVGYIAGLDQAIETCAEASKEFTGE